MGLISFAAFTLLVAIIAWWSTRKTDEKSSDGYFLGGRSLTGPVIAGSLLLTNLSTEQIVGMNGVSFRDGLPIMAYEVLAAVAMVFTAFILLPKYLKGGITTIPQFLENRYGKSTKTIVSLLFLLGYAISMLPTVLYSGALAINSMFDIPEMIGMNPEPALWVTVWAIGIIGSIYAIFGGLKAVAVSDTVNAVGLIIGGSLIPIFGLMKIGDGNLFVGLKTLTAALPEKFDIIGGPGSDVPFWTLFTGMIIVNFYYWGTNQAIIQRALGAKNLKEGQIGLLLAAFIKMLGPFIVVLPGIIAFYLFNGDLANADEAYPMVVKAVLPVAFDFYKEFMNSNASEKQVVRAGKLFGIVLALFSMGIAPLLYGVQGGIFTYLQELNGTHSVPILAIIIVGVFSKRVSGKAANIAILFSVFTYLVTLYVIKPNISFLHLMGILFVLTIVIMFFVSQFVPRKTDYTQEYTKQVDITPWKYLKPVGFAILAAVVGIYVYLS